MSRAVLEDPPSPAQKPPGNPKSPPRPRPALARLAPSGRCISTQDKNLLGLQFDYFWSNIVA